MYLKQRFKYVLFLSGIFFTKTAKSILKNKSVLENYKKFCLKHLSSTLIYLTTLDMSLSSKMQMKPKENDITTVLLFKEFCIELKSSFGFIDETELSIIFINYNTKNVYHESTIFLYSSVYNKPVCCFLYMNINISFDVFSDMYTYDIFAPPF